MIAKGQTETSLALAALSNLDGMVFRCRHDADWTMEYVSEGCARLTGYQPQDLLFNNRFSYESLMHFDDRERVRNAIHEALAAAQRYEVEYRIIDAHGHCRWVQERGIALRDANGRVTSLQGLITDITRLKLTELKLSSAEARYRGLFDNALEGIFRCTVDGRIIDANPALASLYGYPCAADMIRDVKDIGQLYISAERRAEFLQQLITHRRVNGFESQVRRKDGAVIWIAENVRLVHDERACLTCLEGTVQDITEQKQYQQSLIAASEAAHAANEAKSAFLANMSHEIRTPLNGVVGMIELLRGSALDRTQRDYLETLKISADGLLAIINDILDFSKIESGHMELEETEFNVMDWLEDTMTSVSAQASHKKIELILDAGPDLPRVMQGDLVRLRQCVVNLLGNAIKFTAQGEVVLRATRIPTLQDQQLLIEVRDTGIGIAPEQLKTLFQPFVQADSSITRDFGGTGLGLSIVRRLVEMMGGQVGVNSRVGNGSTFWFRLPLRVPDHSVGSWVTHASRTARVLVVESQRVTQQVMMRQLHAAGYQVQTFTDGVPALNRLLQARLSGQPYEVAIVASQLNDMSGLQLIKAIGNDRRLYGTRLVLVTDLDFSNDLSQVAECGLAARLLKPLKGRALLACVEQVLARSAGDGRQQDQMLATGSFANSDDHVKRFVGRILLVEDNRVNQMVARNLLERCGCSVDLAHNGADALELYQAKKFDLVLMDMQMPVMDGITATRKIRDFEGWRPRTPIVALTANATTDQSDRCLAAGMDGFLTKPIEMRRLYDILERYLVSEVIELAEPEVATLLETSPMKSDQEQVALLVNWSRFDILIAGEIEFGRQLIDVYLESSAAILEELQQAADMAARERFRRAVHKLKGASANICAEQLHTLCVQTETSLNESAAVTLQTVLLGLNQVAAETQSEMLRYWRRLHSAAG